jgi:hypothetical protein
MKVFKDSISLDLWKKCLDDVNSNLSDSWKVSTFAWPRYATLGISGNCLFRKVNPELRLEILEEIKDILPYCNKISMNYHVTLPNGGIALHDDSNHKFGATIYLNKEWHINHGGLFVWQEEQEDGSSIMKALVPECRSLVLNDIHEGHVVTLVSNYLPEPRISIQIFGS